MNGSGKLKVCELFAGIGGFRLGIEQALGKENCEFVYVSEWDKYAAQIYEKNFRNNESGESVQWTERGSVQSTGNQPNFEVGRDSKSETWGDREFQQSQNIVDTRDITTVPASDIPDFDLLTAGFPCQSFSIAGKRGGFDDTRGTLFFDIARIVKEKRPKYLLLENVKGLLSHDSGRTFKIILSTLTELHYDLQTMVLNSKNYGVAQNRERVFIIGHLRGTSRPQVFPIGESDDGNNQQEFRETKSVIAGTINLKNQSPQWQFDASTTLIAGRIDRNQFKPTKDESLSIDANYWKGPDNHGQRTIVGTLRTHKDGQGFREVKSGLSPTIPARAKEDGSGQPVIAIPVLTPDRLEKRQNGRRFKEDGDPSFTLTAQDKHGVYDGIKIRRLTPVECEKLQGFPVGWTKQGIWNNQITEISDTQRYKVLGNAVTTNVVQEIIKRMFNQ